MKSLGVRISVLFMAAAAAVAQGGGGSTGGAGGPGVRTSLGRVTGNVTFPTPRFIPQAVVGAPYSAEQIQEHLQTLNDGTHISQTQMHTKMYRDSQGRTRTERPLMMALANRQDSPTVVEITDPVAGVHYTLDTQNKVAHRVAIEAPGGGAPGSASGRFEATGAVSPPALAPLLRLAPAPQAGIAQTAPAAVRAQRDATEEKLPPQMIEGVLAEGVRRTTIIPEGAQGNDRPFSITSETWTAPDLKMVVLSKTDDPRSGESIMKLTNISRNEPDPSLFQAPPDYQVVEESGPFTISYSR
jgi:hypothetical protein